MVATKRNEKYFHFGVKTPVMSGPICILPSDKADSLGVRLELMKEGQHHRNESADWSELLRSLYLCRILTPTKFRR